MISACSLSSSAASPVVRRTLTGSASLQPTPYSPLTRSLTPPTSGVQVSVGAEGCRGKERAALSALLLELASLAVALESRTSLLAPYRTSNPSRLQVVPDRVERFFMSPLSTRDCHEGTSSSSWTEQDAPCELSSKVAGEPPSQANRDGVAHERTAFIAPGVTAARSVGTGWMKGLFHLLGESSVALADVPDVGWSSQAHQFELSSR